MIFPASREKLKPEQRNIREAREMDGQSWRLFLETGDPLCYLLCRVEKDPQAEETSRMVEEDAPSAAG